MEELLFTFDNWNEIDIMEFNFTDIKFIVDFGIFRKGDEYDWAIIDYENRVLKVGFNFSHRAAKTQAIKLSPA